MKAQAVRPSFYQDFQTKVDEVVEKDDEKEDKEQAALAYITHYRGWELLKEYKARLEEYLDTMVSEAMSQGLSVTEIGERTMVKELSKYVLNSLIDKAEDARRIEEK